VALTTFIVVIVIENVYNFIVYFSSNTNQANGGCNHVTDNYWVNQAIWFVSRGSDTVLWIYPFMIMWIIQIRKDQTKVMVKKDRKEDYWNEIANQKKSKLSSTASL